MEHILAKHSTQNSRYIHDYIDPNVVAAAAVAANIVANPLVLVHTPNASQNGWWNEFIDAANR